jgi:glycosyltransferase involved in cell wall biosynthesis
MNPLVSIIMAVYNGEKYINEAILSLLNQTYPPTELIIIDDGSTDDTPNILRNFKNQFAIITQSNQGQPAAQNLGIQLAKGKYIGFLDSDDVYASHKISTQVEFLEQHPQIDMIYGYVKQFISPELPEHIKQTKHCPQQAEPGYIAIGGLFKKECFEITGLFDTQWRVGYFIDWYMRAKEQQLKEHLINDIIAKRRIHDNNLGTYSKHYQHDYLRIVKAAMDRRQNHSQGCENG